MSTLAFLRVAHSMRLGVLDLLALYEVRRINGCRMADISVAMDAKSRGHAFAAVNRLAGRDMLDLGQSRPGKKTRLTLTMAGCAVLNELERMNHGEALFPGSCGVGTYFRETDANDPAVPRSPEE